MQFLSVIVKPILLAQTESDLVNSIRESHEAATMMVRMTFFTATAILLYAAYSIAKNGLGISQTRRISGRGAAIVALLLFVAACGTVAFAILFPYLLPSHLPGQQ
jgi:hypothetical protein